MRKKDTTNTQNLQKIFGANWCGPEKLSFDHAVKIAEFLELGNDGRPCIVKAKAGPYIQWFYLSTCKFETINGQTDIGFDLYMDDPKLVLRVAKSIAKGGFEFGGVNKREWTPFDIDSWRE